MAKKRKRNTPVVTRQAKRAGRVASRAHKKLTASHNKLDAQRGEKGQPLFVPAPPKRDDIFMSLVSASIHGFCSNERINYVTRGGVPVACIDGQTVSDMAIAIAEDVIENLDSPER